MGERQGVGKQERAMGDKGGLNTEELMQDFSKTLVAGKSIKGAMEAVGAGKGNLWQVNINSLRVLEGFNVRVRNAGLKEHIEGLAASMGSEEGYIQHHVMAGFVAQEGDEQVIYLTDGHCRLEAIHLANLHGAQITTVPVVVSTKGTSMEDLTIGLVRSNSGKRLDPFELAVVAKRLAKWNWTHKNIAARMGVSMTTVQNYLSLMEAPKEVRDMVAEGVVGLHTALETMRSRGADAVGDLKRAAEGNKGSVAGHGKRVERRDVVVPTFGSTIKKAAPRLYATISELRSDLGYKSLSDETRAKIDTLVSDLEDLRKKASDAMREKSEEQAPVTDAKAKAKVKAKVEAKSEEREPEQVEA
jgi:hypothetical protein